jgi:hypothetical protein
MRYTIRHTFDTDEGTFWGKIFFDPAYNEALFLKHLGFQSYKLLELDKQPDGSVKRRVECSPKVEIPAAVKKVIGDSASYTETGRFDPKTRRFSVEVQPRVAGDRIKTKVTMWVEPRGEKKIERVVEVDSTVKVFGVGGMVEKLIEQQTRASYDAAAAFTNRWIAERGL